MSKTNYPGIDYGLGRSNVDTKTGIRYGLISVNSERLNHDATEYIYEGKNLSFENYQNQVKKELRSALSDYFFDNHWHNTETGEKEPSRLDNAVDAAFEAIEQELSDSYQSDNDTYLYEKDGYRIQTGESDFWVLQSPFYTFAQFCSPCAPGAGNLDCPLSFERDASDQPLEIATTLDQNKTFCLGHDWFEDCKAPYPVFSVETGKEVQP